MQQTVAKSKLSPVSVRVGIVYIDDAHRPGGVASPFSGKQLKNNDALNTNEASLIIHNDAELLEDVLQILDEDPSKREDIGH